MQCVKRRREGRDRRLGEQVRRRAAGRQPNQVQRHILRPVREVLRHRSGLTSGHNWTRVLASGELRTTKTQRHQVATGNGLLGPIFLVSWW